MRDEDRDPGTENFINSLPLLQTKIYKFMRYKYEVLTNDGENYEVESIDPLIAKMASKEFSITEDEAADLYIATGNQIHKFHMERLHN
ncbi:hypothetical protein GCM10011351_26930 [Paraliobacillus quinghaiensis]|uniref:Uncharacterized protein n=1 Tax=Paraliobacillus quinghaiensis TaxID=470815 RepID=A0A917WXT0_9BACI|nr:hypothetical protein [Paraliobacillus quinghaiensis]GGM39382.1 hypothetical protein GCM10011351_26930 [Paraliobacillus quinghaiensis]